VAAYEPTPTSTVTANAATSLDLRRCCGRGGLGRDALVLVSSGMPMATIPTEQYRKVRVAA
jgi:hypothetical protein